jgi:uncharacterized membrane protein
MEVLLVDEIEVIPTVVGVASASAVNESGEVVGWMRSHVPGASDRGFYWKPGGPFIDLGPQIETAVDINDHGEVLARGFGGSYVWTVDGGAIPLGLGGAGRINNVGGVVGRDGGTPYYWSESTGRQSITGFCDPERARYATDLNDAGEVVGWGFLGEPCQIRAFVWTPSDEMRVLPTLEGADDCRAHAINAQGTVVGLCQIGNPYVNVSVRAVLWRNDEEVVDLNPRQPGPFENRPGSVGITFGTIAYGINDHDEVVGQGRNGAFYWSEATGITYLRGLLGYGWGATAWDINNDGVIVGRTGDFASTGDDTVVRAVVWSLLYRGVASE